LDPLFFVDSIIVANDDLDGGSHDGLDWFDMDSDDWQELHDSSGDHFFILTSLLLALFEHCFQHICID